MTLKKEILGALLIASCSVLVFNGMQQRRGHSAPDVGKVDDLAVVGVGRNVRPVSSLGGEKERRSKSVVRHRVRGFVRPATCLSAHSDDSSEAGSSSVDPQDLRPTVRSVVDRERMSQLFGQWRFYVADRKAALLNKLISSSVRMRALKEGLKGLRAGRRTDSAILFCDIRNFTSITELNDPQRIMDMLNEYFGAIVKVISKNHGVVDKFIGDAILAEFFFDPTLEAEGAATPDEVCANAVKSAMEIIDFTQTFDLKKFALKDDEEQPYLHGDRLQNGIGITFGKVVFGALGSEDRCELTVIGDEVNLASRLQDLNKNPDISRRLERPIVVSQAVQNLLPEAYKGNFVPLGPQRIKGKRSAIDVFGYGRPVVERMDDAVAAEP